MFSYNGNLANAEEKSFDFKQFVRSAKFQDNSEFIKYICDKNPSREIYLFPAGSGKTINLLTLKYFFGMKTEKQGDIFEHMAISKEPKYMKQRGQYPVIYLDIGDFALKENGSFKNFEKQISELYKQFIFVKKSLQRHEQIMFDSILNMTSNDVELGFSLMHLMQYIKRDSHSKTILLIDGYEKAFHLDDSQFRLLRNLISRALKSEPDHVLEWSVVMGSPVKLEKEFLPNTCYYHSTGGPAAKYFPYAERELKIEESLPLALSVSDDCLPQDTTPIMSSTTNTTPTELASLKMPLTENSISSSIIRFVGWLCCQPCTMMNALCCLMCCKPAKTSVVKVGLYKDTAAHAESKAFLPNSSNLPETTHSISEMAEPPRKAITPR